MKINSSRKIQILVGSLFFILLMIVNFDLEMNKDKSTDLNPLGIEAIIYPNEAIAQTSCTFNCRIGLNSCTGQNCLNKYTCSVGCGDCSFEWVKYGESTSGTCNNSGSGPTDPPELE